MHKCLKMIKLKSLLLEKTLYHGTTTDYIKDITSVGLIPMRGDFVSDMYDEYDGSDLKELVFATDKQQLGKAVNAITHHISKKLNKSFHDVTNEEFIKYGAIVKIHDGESILQHREEGDENYYGEHPPTVEPGDYYSENSVSIDEILTGKPMIRLLRRYGKWPLIWMGQTQNQRQELIRLVIKLHPNKPKDKIIKLIQSLPDKSIDGYYHNYKQRIGSI